MKNLRIGNPEELLKFNGVKEIPGIVSLAKKYDIEIIIGDVTNQVLDNKLERSMGNIRGVILIDDKTRKIAINDECTPTTRRFIAAYLFSSYQLKSEEDKEFVDIVYDESIYDEKVYDYTLGLLIPDHLFDNELQLEDKKLLSKIYKVSEFLIEKKLEKKQKNK